MKGVENYHGEITEELDKLYDEYYNKFNCYPDEYDDVEYFEHQYDNFVRDIKKAIKLNKEIEEIYNSTY